MAKKLKKKVEINISGMTPTSCVLNIEEDSRGVSGAQVNFGTKKATVEYGPEKVKIFINISLKRVT